MKRLLFISLVLGHPCFAGPMQSSHADGQALGKKQNAQAIKKAEDFKADEWMPKDAKLFDADNARKSIESHRQPSSEVVSFLTSAEVRRNERENKNFHPDEFFLKNSEKIAHQANQYKQGNNQEQNELIYSMHTCKQAGDPFLMSTERTLDVQVEHIPGELAKVCLGHQKKVLVEKNGDFKKSTKHLEKKYKNNPTIEPESVQMTCIHAHATPYHYLALVYYEHVENAEGCKKCKMKKVKEDSYKEIREEWILENPDLWNLAKSPECTIVEQTCLDANPKTIHGKTINRQCWKEKITFLYQFPKTKECEALKDHLCEQIGQTCIQQTPFGCAMWELSFRCFDQINRQFTQADPEGLYGFSEYSRLENSQPNRSFAEVAAKIAIFDEAKKELEKSKTFDANTLEIFKGKRMRCSKNVADNLIYDCCFSYSGLAKQMGLIKCTSDEIGLAEMREQGLCYYIGSYEGKVLDLWKSRDEHVYCCFPSKLARIVQEQGRKQLGMDWGKPKKAQCEGFSFEMLAKLDFNKMDLSEMFDQLPNKLPEGFQDKMTAFQNRLQEQIQREELEVEMKRRSEGSLK